MAKRYQILLTEGQLESLRHMQENFLHDDVTDIKDINSFIGLDLYDEVEEKNY